MPRPRKFVPGEKIIYALDAVEAILNGAYIYENHKPQHPSWTRNWSIEQIALKCRGGRLRNALQNPELAAKE